MDIVLMIAAGLIAGFLINKGLDKFTKAAEKKAEEAKEKLEPAEESKYGQFAEHIGKGKKCPPHAWRGLHEDRYGLQCDWCKATHP